MLLLALFYYWVNFETVKSLSTTTDIQTKIRYQRFDEIFSKTKHKVHEQTKFHQVYRHVAWL